MTIEVIVASLARLIAEKPELAEALQSVQSTEEAVEILAKAGEENGVAVDKAALAAYFAERAAAAGTEAKLSEGELDQVSGGGTNGILLTVLTFGIGCALVTIISSNAKRDCVKELTNI